jgi:hypothetical protein
MSTSCECCVLSGRDLCDGASLVQRSHTDFDVPECDREASTMRGGGAVPLELSSQETKYTVTKQLMVSHGCTRSGS